DFSGYNGADVTSGDAQTLGTHVLDLSSLIMEPSPPSRPAYDTDNDGVNDSDFQVGGGVIIADRQSPTSGVACGRVTAINVGSSQITVDVHSTLSSAVELVAVPAQEYRVAGTQLLWNGNVVANDIEDFQVTYIIDNDDDNQVDAPQEIFGDDENVPHNLFDDPSPNYGGGTIALSASMSAAALVREVRVSMVARTRLPDEEFTSGQPQGTENRDVSGLPADGFRRRVLTTKVMTRNIGIEI
ncbi:MAG: PilW family protein, partial [Myxococcales bacterium]|nr:PilW family protein [Myxococcales bacterium]